MKKPTISSLKKKLDVVFSKWIRARDNSVCFTCRKKFDILQAGHFISRQHNATRYDERNVNAQCVACNVWKRGNIGEYTFRLIEKYGKEELENLVKLGRTTKQFTIKELEELIKKYGCG